MRPKRASALSLGNPDARLLWAVCGLHLALWLVIPALTQGNPPLDVIEGYVWGRDLQWGYAKHPPLPTFLQEMLYRLTGAPALSAFLLSQVSIGLTFLAVWLLARRITTPAWAAVATLLLLGILYFQHPTPEFNHNVAQMPIWAWGSYLIHRCWREDKTWPWIALSLVMVLGLLTKYSVALLAVAAFLFFMADPLGRARLRTWRPWAAALLTLLLAGPHLHWLVESEFLPFRYALSRAGAGAGAEADLLGRFLNPLDFLINETLDHLGLIIAALLLTFFPARAMQAPQAGSAGGDGPAGSDVAIGREDRVFLLILGLSPLAVVLLLGLLTGFEAKHAWGAPFYSLSGLIALALLRPKWDPRRLKAALAFLLALSLTISIGFGLYHLFGPEIRGRASKSNFPGPEIAQALNADLRAKGAPQPSIVVGHTWVAGNVAFNLPGRPQVLIDGSLAYSPWIDQKRLSNGIVLRVWRAERPPFPLPKLMMWREPAYSGKVSAAYRHAAGLPDMELAYELYLPGK